MRALSLSHACSQQHTKYSPTKKKNTHHRSLHSSISRTTNRSRPSNHTFRSLNTHTHTAMKASWQCTQSQGVRLRLVLEVPGDRGSLWLHHLLLGLAFHQSQCLQEPLGLPCPLCPLSHHEHPWVPLTPVKCGKGGGGRRGRRGREEREGGRGREGRRGREGEGGEGREN